MPRRVLFCVKVAMGQRLLVARVLRDGVLLHSAPQRSRSRKGIGSVCNCIAKVCVSPRAVLAGQAGLRNIHSNNSPSRQTPGAECSSSLRLGPLHAPPARRVPPPSLRVDAGGPGSLRQNLRLNSRVRRICQSLASNAPQEPAAAFEWHIAQGLPRRHMATTTRARMTVVRRSATRSSYSTHQDRAPWCPLASKTTLVLSRACTTWRRIAQFTGSMATCLVPMQRTCQPTLFGTSTLRARPGRPTPPNGCGS